MNMKLVKYMLIAILVLGTGEVAAQVQVVSGKVTEMLGNQIEPIVGANVNIVNAQNRSVGGAVTNLDGDYRLQIPAQENNLTLVYSYIGMKTKRIKYTGQKVLNVNWNPMWKHWMRLLSLLNVSNVIIWVSDIKRMYLRPRK